MSDNKPPELPGNVGPDIQQMLDRVDAPKSPADVLRDEANKYLEALPTSLQLSILTLARNTAKEVLAQQTQGDGSVKATDENQSFYDKRFEEVLESGLLNPHVNPAKKIV